jgi:hypothetical protein
VVGVELLLLEHPVQVVLVAVEREPLIKILQLLVLLILAVVAVAVVLIVVNKKVLLLLVVQDLCY